MEYKENRYRSSDGLELYYREYGAGDRAVVCLHGLSRNSKDFHDLATHLSTRYRVICPDLRGRGQSQYDPSGKTYNMIAYTQDVQRLLDDAGLARPVLIGTSLGAFISLTMAYLAPERLRAIVLNDAGPEVDPVGIKRIMGYSSTPARPPRNWEEAAALVKSNHIVGLTGLPDSFWADYARLTYHENDEGVPVAEVDPKVLSSLKTANTVAKILKSLNAIGLVKQVRGIPVDAWVSFRAVSMPCLVLRGETSDILSAETVKKMRAIKPDLVTATIPDRGHAPLLDEPASLAAIDGFLESLDAG